MGNENKSNKWDKKRLIIESIVAILCAVIGTLLGASTNTYYYNGEKMSEAKLNNIMAENVELLSAKNSLSKENSELQQKLENLNTQYEKLKSKTNELSVEYNTENTQLAQEVEDLRNQLNNMVRVQLKDMGLSIDGEIKPINASNSSAVIDNRVYYSEEILKSLIDNNTNMTIKDNTMYIGRIIKESAYLLDKWVVDSASVSTVNNVTDSLGTTHINALLFSQNGKIIYNLKGEYSLIKFKLALSSMTNLNFEGILTIKADDKIVYESPKLKKENASYDEVDIPINNCSLLTIEFNYTYSRGYCIMSDIVIYN